MYSSPTKSIGDRYKELDKWNGKHIPKSSQIPLNLKGIN